MQIANKNANEEERKRNIVGSDSEDGEDDEEINQEYDILDDERRESFSSESDGNAPNLQDDDDEFFGAQKSKYGKFRNSERNKRTVVNEKETNFFKTEDVMTSEEKKNKEMGLKRNGFAKKPSKLKGRADNEKKNVKVLTFVDMSHLGYLSRSVIHDSALKRGSKQKKHTIPKNTATAIIEDASEE